MVLNVTRKNGEWRFYEFLHLRPEDISVVSAIVTDMRKWAHLPSSLPLDASPPPNFPPSSPYEAFLFVLTWNLPSFHLPLCGMAQPLPINPANLLP